MAGKTVLLILFVVLSGCESVKSLPVGAESSTLTINASSDSTHTTTKVWRIFTYNDQTCRADDKGALIAKKSTDGPVKNGAPTFESIGLPSGKLLTVGFGYVEARFAQNRECSFTINFVPNKGEKYTADFQVSHQSLYCAVNLKDSTGAAVAVSTPERSCVVGFLGKIENGRPGILDWN